MADISLSSTPVALSLGFLDSAFSAQLMNLDADSDYGSESVVSWTAPSARRTNPPRRRRHLVLYLTIGSRRVGRLLLDSAHAQPFVSCAQLLTSCMNVDAVSQKAHVNAAGMHGYIRS